MYNIVFNIAPFEQFIYDVLYLCCIYCQLHNNYDTFEKKLPAYEICTQEKKYIRAIIHRRKKTATYSYNNLLYARVACGGKWS